MATDITGQLSGKLEKDREESSHGPFQGTIFKHSLKDWTQVKNNKCSCQNLKLRHHVNNVPSSLEMDTTETNIRHLYAQKVQFLLILVTIS
jgi:hypothetical protein